MTSIEGIETAKAPRGRPKNDLWGQKRADQMEISELFSELPTGFQIKVYRKSPEWASGYLGEMFQSNDSPLSLEELKNRFGGQVLVVQVVDENSKFRSQKTIKINDVPKVDYKELDPSYASTGTLYKINNNGTSSHAAAGTQNAFGFPPGQQQGMPGMMQPGMIPPGLPPKLQKQLMSYYFGFSLPDEQPKKDNPFEMMQQKMLMDMMTQSTTQQSTQMQNAMEMQRDMMRMRREWETSSEPKLTPMESMANTIAMVREMKSMQGEFGGGGDNAIAEITSQAIPALESLLGEVISLKKVSMQTKAAQQNIVQQPAVRELPDRIVTQEAPVITKSVAIEPSIEELAAQLGKKYGTLTEEKQQELINIFMAESKITENDTKDEQTFENNEKVVHTEVIPPDDDILDEEDRKLIENDVTNTGESM